MYRAQGCVVQAALDELRMALGETRAAWGEVRRPGAAVQVALGDLRAPLAIPVLVACGTFLAPINRMLPTPRDRDRLAPIIPLLRPESGQPDQKPVKAPRLLDQVRASLYARHYSKRTVRAYVGWIRRFILFHGKRHPADMGGGDVAAFLSDLANEGKVSSST